VLQILYSAFVNRLSDPAQKIYNISNLRAVIANLKSLYKFEGELLFFFSYYKTKIQSLEFSLEIFIFPLIYPVMYKRYTIDT
jgi:hypothetical protein